MIIGPDVAALDERTVRERVLEGILEGRPRVGPMDVHIDVTNACNAACVTCWDHSPHLTVPRPLAWKGRILPWETFASTVADLERFGSVRHVVLSGMGEPLTHPRIYDMIAAIKAQGWRLTILSNLVAADTQRLADSGVDTILAGVQGTTPETHAAFHPGWDETHFFRMCRTLRALTSAGVTVKHVQVIDTHTADEIVEMVDFGHRFKAERVNYKLASLVGGTEVVRIRPEQRRRLIEEDVPAARARADQLGVRTNLALFERQLAASDAEAAATTPMDHVGCFMGYAYTRITVDGEILYCCNTAVEVGRVGDGDLVSQWFGERWQAMRERIGRHEWLEGCDRCGKFEQNVKWRERRDMAVL